MIAEAAIFTCSICGEPSSEICVYCTKDACANHRCERCKRCSDCCECDVPLSASEAQAEPAEAQAAQEIVLPAEPAVETHAPEAVADSPLAGEPNPEPDPASEPAGEIPPPRDPTF